MKVYVSACIVKKSSSKDDFKKKLEELKTEAKKNNMCLRYDINYTEHVAFITEEWIAFNPNGDVEISDEHKKILDYFKKNDLFTLTVFNDIKTVFESGFRLENI